MTWIWFGEIQFASARRLAAWRGERVDGCSLRWPAGFHGEAFEPATVDELFARAGERVGKGELFRITLRESGVGVRAYLLGDTQRALAASLGSALRAAAENGGKGEIAIVPARVGPGHRIVIGGGRSRMAAVDEEEAEQLGEAYPDMAALVEEAALAEGERPAANLPLERSPRWRSSTG
jgi:hypothetical protein